jgi:hypothetical protein
LGEGASVEIDRAADLQYADPAGPNHRTQFARRNMQIGGDGFK